MALASPTEVRAFGGLDDANAHELFYLANSAALDAAIAALQPVAVAWLKGRAPTYYTGTAPGPDNTDTDQLFKTGEILITLHYLLLRLKVRRVTGSHFAVDQESSDRFEELIDNEFLKMAEGLLDPFFPIEVDGDGSFAGPAMALTDELDPADFPVLTERYEEDILVSQGMIGTEVLS